MVRIPGTEKLSQPRDGEDDERDNDDDDDGMKLGTMDLPQSLRRDSLEGTPGGKTGIITPLDTPEQRTCSGAVIFEYVCVCVCVCVCVWDFQGTLGHRPWPLCGSTEQCSPASSSCQTVNTHTHTCSWLGRAPGRVSIPHVKVYKEVLTAVAPPGGPSSSCG